ncbi:MAG: amidohydrolase family protein [Gemmatimonadaceae bacterium]
MSTSMVRRTAILVACMLFATQLRGQQSRNTVAFTGIELHDGLGRVLPEATLVIRGEKIAAVRAGGAQPGEKVVDLHGRVVIPGLIDANSSLSGGQGFNYNREDPVLPNLRVQDGIETLQNFHAGPVASATGLVVAYLSPGAWRPIGGQGVTIRLDGETLLDMQMIGTQFVHFSINEGALFPYGLGKAMPQTHMGIVATIRDELLKARRYARLRATARGSARPAYDPDLETLAEVLSGKRIARIDVDTAAEIERALSLAAEFGIRPILEHCVEAYKVRDLLAKAGFPVILMPYTQGDVYDVAVERKVLETPGWLAAHGVPVAFQTFGHGMPPYGNTYEYNEPQNLLLNGILQVRAGMRPEAVLSSITSVSAKILGIGDRMGSLGVGRSATFVVLDGQPFEYATHVEQVWIDGRRVFDAAHDPIVRR